MKTGDMNPTELANFIAKGIANNPGARHLPQFPTPVRHAALRAITGARSGSNRDFRGQVDKALFDVPAWWGKATPALAHSRRGDFNAGNPNYRGRSDPGANRTSFEEWKAAAGNIKLNDREVMNFMEYWVKYFVVKIETHLKAATPGRMKEMWGFQVGRTDKTGISYALFNNHVAFEFAVHGTATRRVAGKGRNADYPIVPLSASMPAGSSVAARRSYITRWRSMDPGERWRYPDFSHMLKFGGNWISGPKGAQLRVRSRRQAASSPVHDRGVLASNIDAGKQLRTNKRGEAYTPFVEHHPGRKPNTTLLRAWQDVVNGKIFNQAGGEVAARTARTMLAQLQGTSITTSREATWVIPTL